MMTNQDIKIFPNTHDLFTAAAEDFIQRAIAAVQDKKIFSVVLSGGNTPKEFFDTLTSHPFSSAIPWQHILFFFADERYVPHQATASNYHMANEYLFSKVPVNPKNIYPIPTHFSDPNEAAKQYEQTIRKVFQLQDAVFPPFDLVYLGLGEDAHTASLMPASEIVRHFSEDISADQNQQLVAALWVPELDMYRVTLTPSAINHGQAIIFLVNGVNKEMAVWNVLKGPREPMCFPAQLIHCIDGKTTWYLDQVAAKKLKTKAIFLDADGVLNKVVMVDGKPKAPTSLAELDIPAEVKPSLDQLKAAGYLLICVTNKPDIARGLMTQADLDAIYHKIRCDLSLDAVFICYVENSDCYKPKPGLLISAAKQYAIELGSSYMIGDRWSDIKAGQNAGCKTIWINRNYANQIIPEPSADYTASSLTDATNWILAEKL